MLTATCGNCGSPKEPAHYASIYCPRCTSIQHEAEQYCAAENPKASESDILYAGRSALRQVAHTAHRNFVDPRQFNSATGMILTPPENKRGTPAEGA